MDATEGLPRSLTKKPTRLLAINVYRRAAANKKEPAINPLATFVPLAAFVFFCVVLGAVVCEAGAVEVPVVLVANVDVVVAELEVDDVVELEEIVELDVLVNFTVELGCTTPPALSVKPQAGSLGPGVSHTLITH